MTSKLHLMQVGPHTYWTTRTWRERLFSWPWRPWEMFKEVDAPDSYKPFIDAVKEKLEEDEK